jgi:hypothetical protein
MKATELLQYINEAYMVQEIQWCKRDELCKTNTRTQDN